MNGQACCISLCVAGLFFVVQGVCLRGFPYLAQKMNLLNKDFFGQAKIWLFLSAFYCACVLSAQQPAQSYVFPYDLAEPDTAFVLPVLLDEISGLSLSPNDSTLLSINDEEGVVYELDPRTGAVLAYKSFWKDGDYEGIEWADSVLWVIKSNGKLYEVRHFEDDSLCTIKHLTPLNKENDVEGLGYDAAKGRLLIAAKGASLDSVRYFFSYVLGNCDTCFVSLFQIHRSQILDYLHKLPDSPLKKEFLEQFGSSNEKFKFKPSAIAVHPLTGEIYILASAGKLLMVCNAKGHILHLQKLNKKQHRQPEGLCFDRAGTLYISNEADGRRALLYVYRILNTSPVFEQRE